MTGGSVCEEAERSTKVVSNGDKAGERVDAVASRGLGNERTPLPAETERSTKVVSNGDKEGERVDAVAGGVWGTNGRRCQRAGVGVETEGLFGNRGGRRCQ